MVQDINAAAGEPLVEAAVGGVSGGGARLTTRGRLALEVYEEIHKSLLQSAAGALQRIVHLAPPDAASAVHLAAAISLQEAVGQILAEFTLKCPTTNVRTIFGASNELADHLAAGAPLDVFISAEPRELDRLESQGLLVAKSRRQIAENGLAVVGSTRVEQLDKVENLLDDSIKRIALAEPASPLGRHSKAYLQTSGIYERLRPKIMHVDNSRAVLAAVVSKAADVGLAFSSDASRAGEWRTLFRVPPRKAAATYEAAILARGTRQSDALALLQFFGSAEARRCLRRCGLRRPPREPGRSQHRVKGH
jgi:molybdate transport system substrate-binding protein